YPQRLYIDDYVIVVPDKTTGMPSDIAGTVQLTIPEEEDISLAINTNTSEPPGTYNQPSSKETTSLKSPKWKKLNGRFRLNDNKVVVDVTSLNPSTLMEKCNEGQKAQELTSQSQIALVPHNNYKNGVDLFDNLMAVYQIRIRGKK
ncbi:hypothetical protein ANN_01292, partial [Periplaneta americana]